MSSNPAVASVNKWSRKLHRWGALLASLPVLVILSTGLLLQLKKEWSWIQPPAQRGQSTHPSISFDQILAAACSVEEAGISSWSDIDRLDVRPDLGIVKVVPRAPIEVQIDTATGRVLQVMTRRSDIIESIHDGSFFGVKLWVFLPAGIVLWCMWLTGVYLWILPPWARLRRRARSVG